MISIHMRARFVFIAILLLCAPKAESLYPGDKNSIQGLLSLIGVILDIIISPCDTVSSIKCQTINLQRRLTEM